MGSLLPISLLQSRPFLRPQTRVESSGALWGYRPMLRCRRMKAPTPEYRQMKLWLSMPPDMQSRCRQRLLKHLPNPLERKRRTTTTARRKPPRMRRSTS